MANISYETGQIKSAIYGEDVRDAIISALQKVANDGNDLASLVDEIEATLSEKVRVNTADIKMKADNLFFNEEEKLLYLMSDGQIIGDGIAVSTGGGGGGGGQSQTFYRPTLVNKLPDRNITTTIGSGVSLEFEYASVDEFGADDGNGVGRIVVGGVVMKTFSAIQGVNTVDITDVLSSGENSVQVKVENSEGTIRTLNYTVTILILSLTTTMAPISSYRGQATVYYTVTGAGAKTVHFVLDGTEIDSEVVESSGRSRSYLIDEQRHGDHILEIWAESNTDNIHLESERIRLSMMWIGVDLTPIIATPFNQTTAIEGDTLVIPYAVYDPASETAQVTLSVIDGNGEVYSTSTINKDRSMSESWIINDFPHGNITFRITCGSTVKNIQIAVEEYTFPISKVTDSLVLEFTADGRSNSEPNPATWSYGNDISATFDGFIWSQTDGWLHDENDKAILRFLPGDTMDIGYTPFATDVEGSGYTIEIEMATHNVRDFDSIVISCMDGGRGFEIKSQKASLFSEQSSVSMLFKEDSHVRITFVVEQKVSTRFIFIYINGIMCGVTQYPLNDNFSQRVPATISIGTDSCGLDLYTIRLYSKELKRGEVLDNLICDRPTLIERRNTYNENNILGGDELVQIDKLPLTLPTMVIACAALPQAKGNATDCTITYTDRAHQDQSFVASNALVDVQGTTSAKYPVKNFTIKLENGLFINGNAAERYPLRPGDIPTDLFCLKVDFASSEGVNNVGLVQLYEDLCDEMGYKTPPQVDNSAIRQGVAGKPIALFWHDTVHNETIFYSKANFNNDKDTPEVFGFPDYPNMEVWDFRNNTTALTNFQSDDFTGEVWKEDLKSIYPAKYFDTTALQRVFTFVCSHNRANAADDTEAAEMLADFKEHFSEYFVTNNMLFYYLFTEFFLMIDSRGKNMHFATFDGTHWLVLPYDMDTALGIKCLCQG
jgi:tetrahydromethanopterin S-methyltransferase subunit B